MKNNDLNNEINSKDVLSVENIDKNEYLVTAAIIEPTVKIVEKKKEKVTLFGALLSAISIRKSDRNYALIRPIKTLNLFILFISITILLYFFYQISDAKIMLGLIVLFGATMVPIILITLHYEICPQKNTSLMHIFISFIFGMVLFLLLDAVTNMLIVKNIYRSTIDAVIVPILWGIGEFIFIAIIARMYNITNLSKGILFAVVVGMGYATTSAFQNLIHSLFVPVELVIDSSVEHYFGLAIVDNLGLTQQSIIQAMPELLWSSFYYPISFACWSVFIANVAIAISTKNNKKGKSVSVYFFLILPIVLFMLSKFSTSYNYFDGIIKIFTLLLSLVVALQIVNDTLNEELNIKNK